MKDTGSLGHLVTWPLFVACCLLLPVLAHGVMEFSVDYAGFRSASPESTSVEIYHSVPYDQLHYQTFGDTIYAEYQVRFSLTSLATGQTTSQALYEPAMIPSFEEAKKRQLAIAHNFSLNLAPGKYLMSFEIRDTEDAGSLTETLTVRDLSQSPSVSDLVIGDKLAKIEGGGTSVLPRPSRTFGPAGPREMYVYLDGYGLTGDTLPYEVSTEILNDSGRVVKSLPAGQKKKTGPDVREIFGLTSQGLKPGTYSLRVNLCDVPTGRVLSTSKLFYVVPAEQPAAPVAPELLTADESREYHDLRRIATDQQLRNYQKLNATGKEEFLRRFWQAHDFRAYLERMKTADARYSWGHVRGRDTDEGRIYLKYGEPDETEAHTMSEQTNPEEHWRYYGSGLHVVFVDVRSDGHYRMVWSNSDTEHNDPNWQSLVDPQELDDLQHENSHD